MGVSRTGKLSEQEYDEIDQFVENHRNEVLDFYTIWGGFKRFSKSKGEVVQIYSEKDGFIKKIKVRPEDTKNKFFKDFNMGIYCQLTDPGPYLNLFDPIKFFDYLYLGLEEYMKHIDQPLSFLGFKRTLGFTTEQLAYYDSCLNDLIPQYEKFLKNLPDDKPLFSNSEEIESYLDVLKKCSPQVLDDRGIFILGPKSKTKSPIAFWFKNLTDKGKVNLELSQTKQAAKLNELIPNLKIDRKSLFQDPSDRNGIAAILKKIK